MLIQPKYINMVFAEHVEANQECEMFKMFMVDLVKNS